MESKVVRFSFKHSFIISFIKTGLQSANSERSAQSNAWENSQHRLGSFDVGELVKFGVLCSYTLRLARPSGWCSNPFSPVENSSQKLMDILYDSLFSLSICFAHLIVIEIDCDNDLFKIS